MTSQTLKEGKGAKWQEGKKERGQLAVSPFYRKIRLLKGWKERNI
jgi:hypothetical protein